MILIYSEAYSRCPRYVKVLVARPALLSVKANGIVFAYTALREEAVLAVSGAILKPWFDLDFACNSASEKTELMHVISARTGMIWFKRAMLVSYLLIVVRNSSIFYSASYT